MPSVQQIVKEILGKEPVGKRRLSRFDPQRNGFSPDRANLHSTCRRPSRSSPLVTPACESLPRPDDGLVQKSIHSYFATVKQPVQL
jgi:hypothetical protein